MIGNEYFAVLFIIECGYHKLNRFFLNNVLQISSKPPLIREPIASFPLEKKKERFFGRWKNNVACI